MLKRIKTKEQEEKNKKRNQLLLGGGLVLLLVLSTAGFSLMNDDQATSTDYIEEKGIRFYSQGHVWIMEIQGQQFYFQNLPSQVEDIQVQGIYNLAEYSGQTLYFVNLDEGASEIATNLQHYLLRYQEACLEGMSCERDLPIKTCNEHIIITLEGENNRVWKEDNCIYISGDPIKGADALIYRLFGIN